MAGIVRPVNKALSPAGAMGFDRARFVRQARDIGPSAVLSVLIALSLRPSTRPAGWPVTVMLALGAVLSLRWRRRVPLAVLGVTVATTLAAAALHRALPGVLVTAVVVAVYAVDTQSTRWRSLGATCAVAVVGGLVVGPLTSDGRSSSWQVVAILVVLTTAWVLGDTIRLRRAQMAALEDRATRLEDERAVTARRAAEDERARIARELHDVVSHHVGVIAIQAGAARMMHQETSDATKDLLTSIEESAHTALVELRRMLGVLRRDPGEAKNLAPQPGLAQLNELLDHIRRAGLPVDLTIVGTPSTLAPGIDLCAYRIIQEALTNVLRHSGAVPTRICIQFRGDAVTLIVTNERPQLVPPPVAPEGQGLVGMRERVALVGGELRTGRLEDGGYEVFAHLPFEPKPRTNAARLFARSPR